MNTKIIAGLVLLVALGFGVYMFAGKTQVSKPMNPVLPMAGAPCHQMGGSWMGDCEFDNNGNVIPPTN
jgi:hypothetical protein